MSKVFRILVLSSLAAVVLSCNKKNKTNAPEDYPWSNIPSNSATVDDSYRFTGSTVVFTIDNEPVYFPEFLFNMRYTAKYYKHNKHVDEIKNWDTEYNGKKLKTYILENAVATSCRYRMIEKKAKELGITLSREDIDSFAKEREKKIRIYGTVEYIRLISKMYVSEVVYNYLFKSEKLSSYLYNRLYGQHGKKCSDQDIKNYIKENRLICVKYIYLPVVDDKGKYAGDKKRNEQRELINTIYKKLKKSRDLIPAFEDLLQEYNSGIRAENMNRYINGRLMTEDYKGDAFRKAYYDTGEKRISGIIEADNGYYILMRMPVFPEMRIVSGGRTLRQLVSRDYLYKKQIEDWAKTMKIEFKEPFYAMNIEIYIK